MSRGMPILPVFSCVFERPEKNTDKKEQSVAATKLWIKC
jgi:hypothetical protein